MHFGRPINTQVWPARLAGESRELKEPYQPEAAPVRETFDARRYPRFKVEVDIQIHSRTCGMLKGHTVDLSESGISALLRMEVPLGEVVTLDFTLPFGRVTIHAVVRQRSAFRYGFQFVALDAGMEIIRSTCRQLAVEQYLRLP